MRKLLLYIIIFTTGLIFLARLFYLQIMDDSLAVRSQDNAIEVVYDYPQRGYISDRNGKLMVSNQPSYDVMAIPRNLKPFDTTEFCKILSIEPEELGRRLDKAKIYSPILPSVIIPQLTKAEYAYLQEKMRKYEGFYIQKRSLRDYQVDHSANVLGYIAQVNQKKVNEDPYYISGDLIGRSGVEKVYEELLRGEKGVKYIQKDRFNRDIGPYKDGIYDTLPTKGKDISITIDAELQAYGEKLMKNKRGGIVAIEPESGEILSLVTAPTYDPALLVGRKRSPNYTRLYYDSIAQPLYDRGLLAEYPPGSPFKTLTGLIALQEGVIDTDDRFSCNNGYHYGARRPLGCHSHPSPLNLVPGIAHSCNSYFAQVYRKTIEKYPTPQEGMDTWNKHLQSFGLGQFMGNDLSTGRPGKIPDADYYNRIYNYPTYKWYSTATISNAIGQGEILMTPIQLANMTATIANRGWYYTPHILKEIDGDPIKEEKFTVKNQTTIDREHFDPVVEGMHEVYKNGTARSLQIPGIEIAGKTGTAENYTKIDGKRTQLTDHSIFVAFAPVDNPKIAIAVFVENGYWGSRYAGRIASLMVEKYIKKEITRTDMEDWILNNSLEEEYAKPLSGEPFIINR
ncbi:penicillin-binding protein 2 [Salegentibacter mishustinae]|uniref:Penicillin-binding protein n=1 Tax=Salegentibacter mishustinae TaxID=270918 RepID=A0A0Q9Z7P4_9FLAO|nr:penicillin-binding protein 2 [Salegentibacter mishustinae]KRG28009.1 penicillin-binding protein [Salegentibacter mishustinae]PNW21079.1 penicillin-binding protein [Salegentibacter mishustinae]PZX63902.1 penicillin-binding protein 2 [Salegentibacter mishustinae]